MPQQESLAESDGRKKYERLRDYMVQEIRSGRLAPGMPLPSEQQLATQLQLARSTVRQAMSLLQREGFINRVHGRGTFVRDEVPVRSEVQRALLALVVPETESGFYPALLASFTDEAARRQCQVIVCNSQNEIERQGNIILQLIDHAVAGVALVPATREATPSFHIRQLWKNDIPVVFCSRRAAGISGPLLAFPFEVVGRHAAAEILQAGHRRIAYFAMPASEASSGYERGFRAAIDATDSGGFRFDTFYSTAPGTGMQSREREVAEHLQALFRRPDPPTAIFASFDPLAELIDLQLSRMGIRVPDDVSLVGFGGSCRNTAMARRLTSVIIDEQWVGQRSIELLCQMRDGQRPFDDGTTEVVPLNLNPGETLSSGKSDSLNDAVRQLSRGG